MWCRNAGKAQILKQDMQFVGKTVLLAVKQRHLPWECINQLFAPADIYVWGHLW